MKKIEKIVNYLHNCPSDINEHFPTLIKYGSQCDHITEMGVRWITSTWAFLGCAPKNGLTSIDIKNPDLWDKGGEGENISIIQRGWNKISDVYQMAEEYGLKFKFIEANVLNIDIEETDLLFLDTWHAYKQLKSELELHASKVKKYIIFHDTTTFAFQDEISYESLGEEWVGDGKGIWLAIEEFLESNNEWKIIEKFTNNNGLTVIKKQSND
jgi:hypothetical protein